MPRAKKAPVETPADFDLLGGEPEVPYLPDGYIAVPAEVETTKSSTKVCSAECPHYTRASVECQECWASLQSA